MPYSILPNYLDKLRYLLVVLYLLFFIDTFSQKEENYQPISPEKITIVRDTFGVAHIFSETDAEVAYGFAWANAEDDFKTIQESLILGTGLSGIYKGKEGAASDFLFHSLNIKKSAEAQYQQMTPEFKKYLDGYCQGLNAYAKSHPKEVLLKKLFPVTQQGILGTYTLISCFLAHIQHPIKDILKGKYNEEEVSFASNAYAFSPAKTVDGKTYLAINPHQPLEGPFSFHEAHLCSNEGLNVIGAYFPMGSSVFMGNNEHLGWGMTFNDYDLVDTYKLNMHPTKKLTYEFDGKWLELEKRKLKLSVKIAGFIKIRVPKTTYWSVYGATFAGSDTDFYSVKTTADMVYNFAEQFYYLNKTKNFDEFYNVLKMQGFPRFNIVYADKEGNIFYINNGRVPKRSDDYDWKGVLPGNTSKTNWNEIYDIEELPQVKNHSCGYVYNANNTPFNATCLKENLDSNNYKKFPENMGLKYTNSNRSIRLFELITEKDKLNFDEFKSIKFDVSFSDNSPLIKSIKPLFGLDAQIHPQLADEINYITNWDRVASKNSVGAAYIAMSVGFLFEKYGYSYGNFFTGSGVDSVDFIPSIQYAKDHFLKYFGKNNVTLGELQRHQRGKVNLPLPGFSDVLAANYTKVNKNGRYNAFMGESYVHFVKFSKNGIESIETLLQYGSSNNPESKDYTDQMHLFSI